MCLLMSKGAADPAGDGVDEAVVAFSSALSFSCSDNSFSLTSNSHSFTLASRSHSLFWSSRHFNSATLESMTGDRGSSAGFSVSETNSSSIKCSVIKRESSSFLVAVAKSSLKCFAICCSWDFFSDLSC